MVADGHAGGPVHALLQLSSAGATLAERPEAPRADAGLAGTTAGWVLALGPISDASALRADGREDLRDFVLELLCQGRGVADELPAAESAAS
jgi:hypothetical protein